MILLWGLLEDSPLALVQAALQRQGAQTFVADQSAVRETILDFTVGADVRGVLQVGSRTCDLSRVTAAYIRPYDSRRLLRGTDAQEGSAAWRHAEALDDGLSLWSELTPALVVNRFEAMAGNSSKPYQALQIRSSGFEVPDTLITTDPAAAEEFWEQHGTVVYKSVSSVRSIVSRLMPEHRDRLADIQWCPTQFQAYVPGTDVRVHVVGNDVFACEILSDADDYRYAAREGAETKLRPYTLPDDCAERCVKLAVATGLLVAGIDLRRTPDECWYCFEVNPSPGFTYYQEGTQHPIDHAIARLLIDAPRLSATHC
ncbi:MAG TPA: hypothetical protein VLA99_14370 [Nitrospiraceae bacterium]|nr:hypothetical protein [Nitrospiraceae bacterium]